MVVTIVLVYELCSTRKSEATCQNRSGEPADCSEGLLP